MPVLSRRVVLGCVAVSAAVAAPLLWQRWRGARPLALPVGVAMPLTGDLAPLGQDMLNGVQMAQEELAREGLQLHRRPLQLALLAQDDAASAEQGRAVARTLIDAGVAVVVGHLNSGVSMAAAPLYAGREIAQLSISTHPRYTQMGLPGALRLVASDRLQARALGMYASQWRERRFAVLDDGTPYGQGLADGAQDVLREQGRTLVLRRSVEAGSTSYGPLVQTLRSGGVDGIVTTLSDFQVLALVQALQATGHTDVALIGGDTLKTGVVQKVADVLRGGVYATSPIIEPTEFPNGRGFVERFRRRFGRAPVYAAHYAFDAMHLIVAAAQRAGSVERAALLRALRQHDGYAPVTGSMRFDAQGEQRFGSVGVYRARISVWEPLVRSDLW